MDRQAEVLKNITKDQRGIEIGPWFSALAPVKDGYNCLYLDVFDTETLKERAKADPDIPNEKILSVQTVDLIGTATAIDKIIEDRGELGTFDYVISSHNFEHSPNPIRFLQGCGRVLKPAGILSMALPDKRACFDYFRPHTTLGQWIEAFFAERERPTLAQVFDQDSLHSRLRVGEEQRLAFSLAEDPNNVCALWTLREAYEAWVNLDASKDNIYHDAHCSVFTPSSLRLLLGDSAFLGLSPFALEQVSETNYNEFYAHLHNVGYINYTGEEIAQYYTERQNILHDIIDEYSHNSVTLYKAREPARKFDELTQKIQRLEASVTQLQARLNEVHRSSSWKITAPLRKLKKVVGKRRP
jgi:SAM-dependent methyltransferase